jgi:hypothetical protein
MQTYSYDAQQNSSSTDFGYNHEPKFQPLQQQQHLQSHGYENNYFNINSDDNSGTQKLGYTNEYNNEGFLLNNASAVLNESCSYGTSGAIVNHSQQRWYDNQAYNYDSFNMN